MPSFPVELRLNHDLGLESKAPIPAGPAVTGEKLPEPEFPMHPEYLTPDPWPGDGERHWSAGRIWRAMNGWVVPFVRSSATSIATTATRTTTA
jgi:hypothetical protein